MPDGIIQENKDQKEGTPPPPEEKPTPSEEEIRRLEKELLEKKAKLEEEKTKEKEMPVEAPKVAPPQMITQVPPAPVVPEEEIQKDALQVKVLTRKRQIETLVTIAFQKGIFYAIRVAKKIEDPYILDEFHDELTTVLYDQLVKEKKIEKL